MNVRTKAFRLDQRRAPIYEALESSGRCGWFPLMCPATSGAAATRS